MLSINVKINYPVGIPLSAQPTTLLLQLFNGDINPNYFLFLRRWGDIKGGGNDHAQSSKGLTFPTPPASLLKAKSLHGHSQSCLVGVTGSSIQGLQL